MALGKYWNEKKILAPITEWPHPGKVNPLLVVSGSCSPVTAAQITYAKANGFEEVIIDAIKICTSGVIESSVFDAVNTLLQQQKNVIVHTGEKQTNNLSLKGWAYLT